MRGDGGRIHAAQADTFVKRQQIEHGQLAGEALGGGDGFFDARGQGHGDIGFDGHGGLGVIGNRESFVALAMRFFESGEGVRGFAGLREDEYAGMAKIDVTWAAAATVFARVFHVDREAAEVFEKNFAVETAVTAGAAGGNEDFARGVGPMREARGNFRLQCSVGKIKIESALERMGLLVDFAQHCMREGGHGFRSGGSGPARGAEPSLMIDAAAGAKLQSPVPPPRRTRDRGRPRCGSGKGSRDEGHPPTTHNLRSAKISEDQEVLSTAGQETGATIFRDRCRIRTRTGGSRRRR